MEEESSLSFPPSVSSTRLSLLCFFPSSYAFKLLSSLVSLLPFPSHPRLTRAALFASICRGRLSRRQQRQQETSTPLYFLLSLSLSLLRSLLT